MFDFDHETNSIIVKRRKKAEHEQEMYMAVNLSTNSETIGDLEYEIDLEKFTGRGNIGIPQMVKNSSPFSKKIGLVTEPVVALKRTMKTKRLIQALLIAILSLVLTACNKQEQAIDDLRSFSEQLKEESADYTEEDWQQAGEQYQLLIENIDQYEYTDDQQKEIGRLKAVCIKQMSKGAMKILRHNMNTISKQLEGALEEFMSPDTDQPDQDDQEE